MGNDRRRYEGPSYCCIMMRLTEVKVMWNCSFAVNILVYKVKKKGVFSGRTKEKEENDRPRVNFNWHFIQVLMPTIRFLCVCVCVCVYTGRFIMISVITNIYNKKTKGHL